MLSSILIKKEKVLRAYAPPKKNAFVKKIKIKTA